MSQTENLISLWPDEIPNYIDAGKKEQVEKDDIIRISKIQNPTIEVFLPPAEKATGQGVLIFPGGGYMILAYDWEGTDIAAWFNAQGIAAFVVKNRLPDDESSKVGYLSPFLDARRAMRIVRHRAEEFGVAKNKIGVMGFSAGGHLAATLSNHYDEKIASVDDAISLESARPDFSILIYPVITMQNPFTHEGSRIALIGKEPSEELINHYSNELQVHENTPPTLLIHSADDTAVPFQNSSLYYEALIEKNISATMHLYPNGGHGYSLAKNNPYLSTWPDRVGEWLQHLAH